MRVTLSARSPRGSGGATDGLPLPAHRTGVARDRPLRPPPGRRSTVTTAARAPGATTKAIDTIVSRRTGAAKLDRAFRSHSLRRGFVTSALAGGVSEHAVQNHGGWKSPASMAPYVDEANRFDGTNPTRFLR
jgi:integrase